MAVMPAIKTFEISIFLTNGKLTLISNKIDSDYLDGNSGCLLFASFFSKLFAPVFKSIFAFNSWIKRLINTISSKLFNKSIINTSC